jgi:hypothetical protein
MSALEWGENGVDPAESLIVERGGSDYRPDDSERGARRADKRTRMRTSPLASGECSKSFRNAPLEWIKNATGIEIPGSREEFDVLQVAHIVPTSPFEDIFKDSVRVFNQSNETCRRTLICLFLLDILARDEFNSSLQVYQEVAMTARSKGKDGIERGIHGKTDFTVAPCQCLDLGPQQMHHLVCIEAKFVIQEGNFAQCVAETASVYASRCSAKATDCSSWGVLTDFKSWQFLKISHEGILSESSVFRLSLDSYDHVQVHSFYRVLYHIVTSCSRTLSLDAEPSATPIGSPRLGT